MNHSNPLQPDLTVDSDAQEAAIYKIYGWSMFPILRKNDRVSIKQQPAYQLGDLAVIQAPGGLYCHRIVSVNNDGTYTTRGDTSSGNDAPASGTQILGKVTQVHRGTRTLTPQSSECSSVCFSESIYYQFHRLWDFLARHTTQILSNRPPHD